MGEWSWRIIIWLTGALITAALVDRAGLWLTTQFVSRRSLRWHRQLAGGMNQLKVHGLNNAENCRTPMSIADALISFCVFDVSRHPLRLRAKLPENRYWSLTCYSVDTTNFFSLNDTQVAGDREVTVVLVHEADKYRASDGELVVQTPGTYGLFLIRLLVHDPEDHVEEEHLPEVQRSAMLEVVT